MGPPTPQTSRSQLRFFSCRSFFLYELRHPTYDASACAVGDSHNGHTFVFPPSTKKNTAIVVNAAVTLFETRWKPIRFFEEHCEVSFLGQPERKIFPIFGR